MIFKHIPGLGELERENKWDETRILLYKMWLENKNDIDINFRLISQCWAPMADGGCTITLTEEEWGLFRNTLIEATEYWFDNVPLIEYYSSIIGYMINLFPYYFYKTGLHDMYFHMWENTGENLIKFAYKKFPNDPITVKIYYGLFHYTFKNDESIKYEEILRKRANEFFTYETEIERYFIDVWRLKEVIQRYT